MTERYIRWDQVVVVALWLFVFGIVGTVVTATLADRMSEDVVRLCVVLLFPMATLTAVLHIRLYAVRLCAVIRATTGPEVRAQMRAVR